MSSAIIIVLVVIILILFGIYSWFYLFNIYETRILVNPESLNVNFDSTIEINVIPLNSFGRRAVLRRISARFELIEGDSLVMITKRISDQIILQSLSQVGKVEILVTPEVGLFPSIIEIEIVEES